VTQAWNFRTNGNRAGRIYDDALSKEVRKRHPRARLALIRARVEAQKSRPMLAREIGCARSYIHNVETGYRDPSLIIMRRWVHALGTGASLDLFAA
jgi:DNA-binding XRE family transcriptional regulator